MSDRYQTTLETLAEHLPLVVVELAVWKGENEAIVVPHVALSSDEVDLAETPAARAAEAVAKVEDQIVNRTVRPPGRAWGHQCPISPDDWSSQVSLVTSPPSDETRERPPG